MTANKPADAPRVELDDDAANDNRSRRFRLANLYVEAVFLLGTLRCHLAAIDDILDPTKRH